MRRRRLNNTETANLGKKYRVDVQKVISLWKSDRSDMEISKVLGVDPWRLSLLREDIKHSLLYSKKKKPD